MTQKVALITGASRGIGKAIAMQLEADGFKLLTPSHEELNLSSNASIVTYLASLETTVDVLVNNAGINRLANCMELLDDDLDETIQVNLVGPIRLTRGIIAGMIEKKSGRIINISSIWSVVSKPRRLSYSISKTGLNGFTRSLAVELAQYNILVNAVIPGFVNTELTKKNNSSQDIQKISEMIPIQRMAEPEEIARLVSFLSSDNNTYITGQSFVIDGGFTCL